jgi:hypothetical protein
MAGGIAIATIGVWALVQLWGGDALERLNILSS